MGLFDGATNGILSADEDIGFNATADGHRKYWCEDGVPYEGFASSCAANPFISHRIVLNGTNTARLSQYTFNCDQADTASEVSCAYNRRFFNYDGVAQSTASNTLTFSGSPHEVAQKIGEPSFCPGCVGQNYVTLASIRTNSPNLCRVYPAASNPIKIRYVETQLEQVVTDCFDGRWTILPATCYSKDLLAKLWRVALPRLCTYCKSRRGSFWKLQGCNSLCAGVSRHVCSLNGSNSGD